MPIFHLLYMSVASPMTPSTLDDILDVSERNNAKCGLTGLLIFRLGHFIQLLEGAQADVLATFEKIAKDRRHSGTRQVLTFESAERLFPQWRMGHIRDGAITRTLYAAIKAIYASPANPSGDAGGDALAILRAFSYESQVR
jgi:hypothetical protein